MLPMRDLLQAEQVCRRWRAVCRCPQRLQHLDLTDAPFNSQVRGDRPIWHIQDAGSQFSE